MNIMGNVCGIDKVCIPENPSSRFNNVIAAFGLALL